jgi:predicted NAD/FAD-binding protein
MASFDRLKIAVIGTGISGLSAAWLLSQRHDVVVYEQSRRIGGHSNTAFLTLDGCRIPVDTGFIVFNRKTYPNLTALFEHLDVPTEASEMSLSVSLDGGDLEYSGSGLSGLFAQKRNLLRPRFWSMLRDLMRFYRQANLDVSALADERLSLGSYLDRGAFGAAFREDHLLPMASAIWSASPKDILSYPAATFIRFQSNHGLLQPIRQPKWETVSGGSIEYVRRLTRPFADRIKQDTAAVSIQRRDNQVFVLDSKGETATYDHVVLATHADQALALLCDATAPETKLLSAFRYSSNLAVLHSDVALMPKQRAAWASWNYMGSRAAPQEKACVTYWMNRLQNLKTKTPLLVTLNPPQSPRAGTLHQSEVYEHPIFDAKAIEAQQHLWRLQGERNTWFCGAYFGYGFHEDGLQAGLAVAEQLGGIRRPWSVADESGRIVLSERSSEAKMPELFQ